MGILRLIPDEMGGWDLEIDREAWRALLKDVDDLLLAEESNEQDDRYQDDYYPYRPETPEERAGRAAADARWAAAFPPDGPWREWKGHHARVRPERIVVVHRLRLPEGDWDQSVQGAMTLCGARIEDPRRFTTDEPTCRNCEKRLTSMRAQKPDA
jgi:predicted SprT family Zn-dependent metalloprotease